MEGQSLEHHPRTGTCNMRACPQHADGAYEQPSTGTTSTLRVASEFEVKKGVTQRDGGANDTVETFAKGG